MDKEQIGAYLRKLRRNKGLSQAQVAGILGVHQTAISQWEKATSQPSLDLFLHVLCLYGMQEAADLVRAILQGDGVSLKAETSHPYKFCPYCGEKLD